jgi:serine/threonine protein kinase
MWWDTDTIDQTVTKQFVRGRLKSQAVKRLDQTPAFGEDLTNSTYWEWIETKSKKIFLILVDLGLANHIFDLIDKSFDDDDLPFSLDQVQQLKLTPNKNEKTERKFYHRQFHYLLRHLNKGSHVDYENPELVPLDIDEKHVAGQAGHVNKVTLPNEPAKVFCRCQIRLGTNHVSQEELMAWIEGIKDLQSEHMSSYWASYTHRGYGYILFTPAPEFSLKSLLTTMPSCLNKLDKKVRPQAVMNWIYCLVDTVCSLHDQGRSHGNIRPSTVHFSKNNFVFVSGVTQLHIKILGGAATESTAFDQEAYNYSAPEKAPKPAPSSTGSPHPSTGDSGEQATDSDNQAADIFSLGCVIMELLSFLFKKQGRKFAAHRAAKHTAAGRGNPLPDSSFHGNIGQVEDWMSQLYKDTLKEDDAVFKGVTPILDVVVEMLSLKPSERLPADQVRERIRQVLADKCGIPEPHCLRRDGTWEFGVEKRLSTASMESAGSAGSAGSWSFLTKRGSGSQDKRSSGGFGSFLRGGSGEAVASRARNGSQSSYNSAQQAMKHIEGASFFREFG